jgi:hypothetical protein
VWEQGGGGSLPSRVREAMGGGRAEENGAIQFVRFFGTGVTHRVMNSVITFIKS